MSQVNRVCVCGAWAEAGLQDYQPDCAARAGRVWGCDASAVKWVVQCRPHICSVCGLKLVAECCCCSPMITVSFKLLLALDHSVFAADVM
jgi:hypothetical protein